MSFTFPQSSAAAVVLPITVVLDGPNGGYQQVESEYSEFLRNKITPEEYQITVEHLNDLMREVELPVWPLFLMLLPIVGCLFVWYLARAKSSERTRAVVEYLEYMNDHIFYPRNIAWRLVEFSTYKWVEISLTEMIDMHAKARKKEAQYV